MQRIAIICFTLAGGVATVLVAACATQGSEDAFSRYVDAQGAISLPEGFHDWRHIGSWAVGDEGEDIGYLHNVYTQPATVAAFQKTDNFPDGAVLVKEVLNAESADMTTGRAGRGTDVAIWFVMIKDSKGRFPDSKLWGDGWGWAMYNGDDPNTVVTEDYKEACIPCHVPAENDDWVYVSGYPDLRG